MNKRCFVGFVVFIFAFSMATTTTTAQLTDGGRKRARNPEIIENVQGQVLTKHDNEPVAGAELSLYLVDRKKLQQELVARDQSDMSGHFSFDNLKEHKAIGNDRYFVLAIRHDEHASKIIKPTSLVEWLNEPEDWKIYLVEPETLVGRVVDDRGEPVSGAMVWRHRFLIEPADNFFAETDMNGEFTMTHLTAFAPSTRDLPGGGQSVHSHTLMKVSHPDLGNLLLGVASIPGETEAVLPRPFIVQGQVIDINGHPQPDIVVSATPFSLSLQQGVGYATAKTDEHGNFRMSLTPQVSYNIWAADTNNGAAAVEVSGVIDGRLELPAIKLEPLVAVQGIVVNGETGEPIDGTETPLRVSWHGPDRPKSTGAVRGIPVDHDGRFIALMVPGTNYPYVSSIVADNIHWSAQEYLEKGLLISRDEVPPKLELKVTRLER